MFSFALLPAVLAASALAVPHASRQDFGPCTNLGEYVLYNANNFTLNAYNIDLSNDNTTGAPLVLAYAFLSTDPNGSYDVLAVSATRAASCTVGDLVLIALVDVGKLPRQ